MGPGIFIIAILGCADSSVDCRAVTTLPTRYESRATCTAATGAALMASTHYDYPELQAECRRASGPLSSQRKATPTTPQG